MACDNCLDNCDPLVTDKCTKYTGPDIDALGICKNSSLYEVEVIILEQLQSVSLPANITMETTTAACAFITAQLALYAPSQPFSLTEFSEFIYKCLCALQAQITVISDANPAFSFDTACLTGDVSTRDKIIQALITLSCASSASLATVVSEYVKQSDLCTQVTACLAAASTQYNTRMVPYVYYPYGGSVANFDNTGKGLLAAGFTKVYLANGLNGTQDWRGRSPIGSILNVPGGTLDSAVDPTISGNSAYNYANGTKYGASHDTLTISQTPAHSHVVTDPGHIHNFDATNNENGGFRHYGFDTSHTGGAATYDTTSKTTGISLGSSGGGNAHNTLHPVIGCLFIVYLP